MGKLNYCLQALKDKGLVKIKTLNQKIKFHTLNMCYAQRYRSKSKITLDYEKKNVEYDELKN